MTGCPSMYDVVQGTFHTPAGHPVTMMYRTETNDWNTLNASLDEDEYVLPSGMSGIALDVGGYLGSVGIALALDNPDLAVTIVEPVPFNADLIEANLAHNGLTGRVTLIRGAVGSGDVSVGYAYSGSDVLCHHAFVGNSSLADGVPSDHETVTYEGRDLASFGPLDYLKIDCEGGEWAFLADGAAGVGTIVGEAHAVSGHRGRDIVSLLKATHKVELSGLQPGYPDGTCGFRAVPR